MDSLKQLHIEIVREFLFRQVLYRLANLIGGYAFLATAWASIKMLY
jgi:hypothetical protein